MHKGKGRMNKAKMTSRKYKKPGKRMGGLRGGIRRSKY